MDKDVALEQIFDDLIFHETLNIIFDTHRAVKKGLIGIQRLHLKLIDSFILKDIYSIMKNRQRLI